jgi:hypothetical protein
MTRARNALATAVIAAACATGLIACGGSDEVKVSSKEFITKCQDEFNKNPAAKAYGAKICGCVQDKLVAQGDGDLDANSDESDTKAEVPLRDCTQQALGQ